MFLFYTLGVLAAFILACMMHFFVYLLGKVHATIFIEHDATNIRSMYLSSGA